MNSNSIEQDIYDLYIANRDIIEDGFASNINDLRGEAMDVVISKGLPTQSVEKYRHSDIRALYERDYEKYFVPIEHDALIVHEVPIDACVIRLVNGYIDGAQDIVTMDNGVVYGSLRQAATKFPDLVAGYYNTLAGQDMDPLAALNTVFMQDGFFLYVPTDVNCTTPIYIVNTTACREDMLSYGRELMIFERGSQAQLIFDFVSGGTSDILTNCVREVFVGKNANINIANIQRINSESKLITNSYAVQDRGSVFGSVVVTLDGAFVRNNHNVRFDGEGAENHTYGIALGSNCEHFDNYTNVVHNVENCTSYENFKGVAADESQVIFNGRIYVAKDAQKTQAFQENRNLLLSKTAKIYTKPQLEIYADDVKCSHGATIGQLDDQAVFYMRQRGISEDQARKLQLYGFVNEVIDKVGLEALAEYLDTLATQKIERF